MASQTSDVLDDLKAVVRRAYLDGMNNRDLSIIDGLIQEEWNTLENMELMHQLGVITPPAS